MKTKAKPAEKTGSNEKISPVCVGVVYCWAITCTMKATAVQNMLKAKMMSHELVVLGSFGVSIMNEKIRLNRPTKPSCMTPSAMEFTCFVTLPVMMTWIA